MHVDMERHSLVWPNGIKAEFSSCIKSMRLLRHSLSPLLHEFSFFDVAGIQKNGDATNEDSDVNRKKRVNMSLLFHISDGNGAHRGL